MSVHLLPNGRWKVRWRDPAVLGADGKPVAKSKTYDRERDARALQAKIDVLTANDERLPHSVAGEPDLTFAQLAARWIEHNSDWAASTRTGNAGLVANHLNPVIGGDVVRKITPQRIMELRPRIEAKLKAEGRESATLVRKAMATARTILGYGVVAGVITSNPADVLGSRGVLPPAERKPRPKPLTPAQIESIRTAILTQRRGRLHHRDAMFVSLMAYGGLRPGEALGLKWSDLDGAKLTIQRSIADGVETKTKRERSDRTITLWQPLLDDLAAWRKVCAPQADDEYIVAGPDGDPWTKNYYDQWRDRTWTRCGPEGETPYILRHSHASLRIRAGHDPVKVARYLGHSVTTLMGRYSHHFDELEDDDVVNPVGLIWAARGIELEDAPETPVPAAELSEDDMRLRLAQIDDERAFAEAMRLTAEQYPIPTP